MVVLVEVAQVVVTANLDPGNGLPNTGGGGGGEDNQMLEVHLIPRKPNSYNCVEDTVGALEQQPQHLHLMKARQLELWLQNLQDTDTTNLTYSLATGNGTTDQHNSLFTVVTTPRFLMIQQHL